jgi:hypothetical protein
VDVRARHEVVQHGHVAEELDVLEGAGDPEPRDLVRAHARDLMLAVVDVGDVPALGVVQAADAVEQAGLACAVGPDDGQDLALAHLQVDIQECGHAAEVKLQPLNAELRLAGLEVAAVQAVDKSTLHTRSWSTECPHDTDGALKKRYCRR